MASANDHISAMRSHLGASTGWVAFEAAIAFGTLGSLFAVASAERFKESESGLFLTILVGFLILSGIALVNVRRETLLARHNLYSAASESPELIAALGLHDELKQMANRFASTLMLRALVWPSLVAVLLVVCVWFLPYDQPVKWAGTLVMLVAYGAAWRVLWSKLVLGSDAVKRLESLIKEVEKYDHKLKP